MEGQAVYQRMWAIWRNLQPGSTSADLHSAAAWPHVHETDRMRQQGVRRKQLWPSGWCPAPEQRCQVFTGRCGMKSTFRGMLGSKMTELRS